ncbi:MAG: lysophospholipid acyltransferase family protein [Pyrinomonadaceae bacterium MAG19_C2-C3]|nr:lysophospholipid acyltransferase family protein [Pyrinomonadaceae bacterium MAG19_C2-C3]
MMNDDKSRRDERVARAYRFADLARYTFKQRLAIKTVDLIFYVLISFIGRTTRFEVEGWEHWQTANADGQTPIYAFWHGEIFLATYFFRRRRIVVMTSQSFDGEYIARFIQRFGYGTARGSTTRGGTGALIEMMRLVKSGCPAGFSVDGPRGPAHVAQPGAILLAKKTGAPVLPFSVHVKRKFEVPSWDKLQVPLPFSRARVRIHAPIYVPPDADDKVIDRKRSELQTALEALSV